MRLALIAFIGALSRWSLVRRHRECLRPAGHRLQMEAAVKTWLLTCVCLAVAAFPVSANIGLLAAHYQGDREFAEVQINDSLVVYYHQRVVGKATVEKDFIVYQIDSRTGELLKHDVHWRWDLSERQPEPLISRGQAIEAVAGQARSARLYMLSPDSDVFPLDPTPRGPCWVVSWFRENGTFALTVVDALSGAVLGGGIAPPHTAYSMTGPQYADPCEGAWTAWAENAENWFNVMGYVTECITWPPKSSVQSHVQSTETAMFYELAHGSSTYFASGCTGGTSYETTSAADIESWISGYTKMPFTFVGSCGGLCSTGDNTFSYEFRRGSLDSTVTVGYCGMAEEYCADCWSNSIDWQHALFHYMSLGWTVKASFDQADADYPMCAASGCMRFVGDEAMTVVPVVTRIPSQEWYDVTTPPLDDPGQAEGVSWGDYDGDGDLDLYVANDGSANLLFWNDGLGQFTEDTGGDIADAGHGLAVSWGDYDNDGDPDLYLARLTGENLLFRNEGSGSFTDVTAPPLGVTAMSRSAPWVDYDNDGHLDLYVVNESGGSNVLLRNMGDGTFVDATSSPLDHSGVGNCVAWGDYDNDGDPDAYLANWGQPNVLFRNDGGGSFADVTSAPLDDAGKATSVCWGDSDNDGDLDLYVCNAQSANRLFRNDSGGVFTDVTSGPLGSTDKGIGASWSDFDNDGDLDLYIANYGVANLLLVNDGGGVFSDGTVFPLDDPGYGGGVTWGDYDGDGDTDLYVGNGGSANLLLENRASLGNHWLHLELEGTMSNRSAIGARARVVAGGVSQIREISGGSGYASQASPAIEFGLGGSTLVDTVQVAWPSGVTTVLTNVAADQVLLVNEGPIVTIYVDGSYPGPGSGTLEDPFPTISQGIAAVPSGGVVSVAPWVYVGPENCDLDFGGKNLSLIGQAGADSTIIKPAYSSPALNFHSGESRASLVEGFTITEGYVDLYGAAVQCVNGSSPILRDLVISSCSADHGGGILCSDGSSPLIEGVWFVDNMARFTGGGIYVGFANPVIRDCVFTGNEAQTAGWGAGLFVSHAAPLVESSTFVRNIGGSVLGCTYDGTPLLTECIIAENAGDAIFYCEDTSNPTVTHSCIYGNAGGDSLLCGDYYDNIFVDPVFCDPDSGDFTLAGGSPCLPGNNTWGELVGGLGQGCFDLPHIEVEPVSIAFLLPEGLADCDTLSVSNLGGQSLHWTASDTCAWLMAVPDTGTVPPGGSQDVLVCADAAALSAGSYQCAMAISSDDPDEPEMLVDVSLEVRVPPDIEVEPSSIVFLFPEGLADCDTLLISNLGDWDLTWSLSDTCAWLSVSPEAGIVGAGGAQDVVLCADASALVQGEYGCEIVVSSDDPDEPQVVVSVSLIVAEAIYVDDSNTGPESGTFEEPFNTIREGIQAAANGGVVRVLPGLYSGDGNRDLSFNGKNISVIGVAGPDSTVIDCGGGAPGDPHHGFIFDSGESAAAVVEGFTIRDGYGINAGGHFGGAIQVDGSSPALRDLIITDNSGSCGGGMYIQASSSVVEDVVFSGNTATATGGAVYCSSASPTDPAPTFTNVTFVGNGVTGSNDTGGTVDCPGASIQITQSILAFTTDGEVITCRNGAEPTVTHCCVYGNALGDSLCGDYYDNIFVDPVFCDPDSGDFTLAGGSPCLPGNNPWGEQIGALGQGCFALPDIEVEPLSITFVLPEGGATCDTLLISNLGDAELNWMLTEACGWLTAAPDTGTVLPGGAREVLLCADASGLVAGNYQCDVTISSDDPDEPEVLVDVSLAVQVPPDIEIDPATVAFEIEEGTSACDTVAISNVGGMDLTWSLSDTCAWLSVSPEAGIVGAGGAQDVVLCADASVLVQGEYGCEVVVSSNDPDEPEVVVGVSLTISVDMHFEVVYQGNPYLAMTTVARSVTLNGTDMEAGDEVGIFDGEYCVGAAVLDSPVGPGDELTIAAAADDPYTPEIDGFTAGNPIELKVWDADQEREFEADGDFWSSPGVPDDGLFEELGLTYVDIAGHGHFAVVFQGNPYNAMSIFVMTASIDSVNLEPDDEIGVFDGDLCVGTGIVEDTITPENMLLLSASADDPVTPEVDGFTAGNPIVLKLWSESGQTEHGTMAAYWSAPGVPAPGVFQELGLIYVDVFTSINQTIPLDAGWNIMSFNIVPPECDLLTGISDVLPCLSRIVAEDGSALFYNEWTEEWVNNIGCMDIRDGYYIRMNCPDDLSLDGGYVQYPISDTLTAGWNIAGFPYYSPIDAMELYADLISDSLLIRVQDEAGLPLFYDPFNQQWVNLIGDMEPGEGYYVSVNEDCDMVFEAPGVAALQPLVVSDLPIYLELSRGHAGGTTRGHFEVVYEGNPYLPMLVNAISVTLDGIDMIEGDEVGLFDGELCVGAAVLSGPVSPGSLLSVPASYDDPNTPESDGFVAGHSILLRVWDAGSATEHEAEGAFWQSPGVPGDSTYVVQGFVYADMAAESGSGVEDGEEDGIPRETRLHPSFPNPFGPSATLAFDLGSPEVVSLAVYSLDGRKVAELLNGPMESGHHAVAWDGRSDQGYELPSGIYFCRLEAGDYSETIRMTLIR